MIMIADYTDADGHVDWKALERARRQAGEVCYACNAMILPGKGVKSLCFDCTELNTEEGEVRHSTRIRCPHCATITDEHHLVHSCEYYELREDGDHTIDCPECGKSFIVTTDISYTFTSPPRIVEAPEPK